jgi:hypothetical protein
VIYECEKVSTDKARVSTYIENSLKEDALKLAAIQGRTLSNYIEQLIKKDVERAKKAQEIE